MTTRALVTDVGNDILYGFSVERTLGWVEEVLRRLTHVTQDIVLTGLPLDAVYRLSQIKFLAFRSMLVPSCRLTLSQVIDRAEGVHEGLVKLSSVYGAKFLNLILFGMDSIPSMCGRHTGAQPGRRFWENGLWNRKGLDQCGSRLGYT